MAQFQESGQVYIPYFLTMGKKKTSNEIGEMAEREILVRVTETGYSV